MHFMPMLLGAADAAREAYFAAHRRSNLLWRSRGISLITKAPHLWSPRSQCLNARGPLKSGQVSTAPILGGSATLSVTDDCRWRGGDVRTMRPLSRQKRLNSQRTLDQITAPVRGSSWGRVGCVEMGVATRLSNRRRPEPFPITPEAIDDARPGVPPGEHLFPIGVVSLAGRMRDDRKLAAGFSFGTFVP